MHNNGVGLHLVLFGNHCNFEQVGAFGRRYNSCVSCLHSGGMGGELLGMGPSFRCRKYGFVFLD